MEFIDLSAQELDEITLEKDEFCIIAASVYEGRIPRIATKNLKKINGNGAKAVLVAVYGNRHYDFAIAELKQVCEKQGFVNVCGITAVSEHSIITSLAKGRPDANDVAQLTQWGETILERYKNNTLPENITVPGTVPDEEPSTLPFHAKANKSCVKCGICASKCPVQAISKEDPSQTDPNKCILCLRCIDICPTDSRSASPFVRKMADIFLTAKWKSYKNNEIYMD